MIGLTELFMRLGIKTIMLTFEVYCPSFQTVANNFNVTAKRMFLPSMWEKADVEFSSNFSSAFKLFNIVFKT